MTDGSLPTAIISAAAFGDSPTNEARGVMLPREPPFTDGAFSSAGPCRALGPIRRAAPLGEDARAPRGDAEPAAGRAFAAGDRRAAGRLTRGAAGLGEDGRAFTAGLPARRPAPPELAPGRANFGLATEGFRALGCGRTAGRAAAERLALGRGLTVGRADGLRATAGRGGAKFRTAGRATDRAGAVPADGR
jgi:hypothetical protein